METDLLDDVLDALDERVYVIVRRGADNSRLVLTERLHKDEIALRWPTVKHRGGVENYIAHHKRPRKPVAHVRYGTVIWLAELNEEPDILF